MDLKFPPIYLLKVGLERNPRELHEWQQKIGVVRNIKEAELVLGKTKSPRRAQSDLRHLGVHTEDVALGTNNDIPVVNQTSSSQPRKRRKITKNDTGKDVIHLDSDTETENDSDSCSSQAVETINGKTIKVLKLDWYIDSLEARKILPMSAYLVYEGRITAVVEPQTQPKRKQDSQAEILARARADSQPSSKTFQVQKRTISETQPRSSRDPPAHLIAETTEEHEYVANLPPLPDYVNSKYCCQRPCFSRTPNDAFIDQLRTIKTARTLQGDDEVGHKHSPRAYNKAIAALASYPFALKSTQELHNIKGCGDTISELFREWNETGRIRQVEEIKDDERFRALDTFKGIYDVGEKGAKEFYNKGWRDLEDVVNYGWESLTNSQQIGTKFYEEFSERIPRSEVEGIANHILNLANKVHPGWHMVICGGYRRGKDDSGDVDVILSHPQETITKFFLNEHLLHSLEDDKILSVTHTLRLFTTNSERDQQTLFTRGKSATPGSGFDTLDKAFVAMQKQDWPTKVEDLQRNPKAKNPNPHRRVDIIISPWKSAGCAVIGWTGGTMFERDLRAYTREELKWKFDSSGVRSLTDSSWIDLEKGGQDLLTKEKLVFEGLGLEWREPTERCTD